jgi:hypothetical protein
MIVSGIPAKRLCGHGLDLLFFASTYGPYRHLANMRRDWLSDKAAIVVDERIHDYEPMSFH